MMNLPAKICKDQNLESATYPSNKHGLYLFNFLKSQLAFGTDDPNDEWIVELMYERWPVIENITKKDDEYYQRIQWAINRIKGLKRKIPTKNFTHLEADFLHAIFTNATSDEWGAKVTPEKIATEHISLIIKQLIMLGLSWPSKVPSYYQFRSVLDAHANQTPFSIEFSEPSTKSVSAASENSTIPKPTDTITTYTSKTLVEILLSKTKPSHSQVLVFYTCDQAFETGETEDSKIFDVRLLRHVTVTEKDERFKHSSGKVYQINPNPGKYCLYAIGMPENWDVKSELGFEVKEESVLSEIQSSSLIQALKQKIIKVPDDIIIASHHYRI